VAKPVKPIKALQVLRLVPKLVKEHRGKVLLQLDIRPVVMFKKIMLLLLV
jgi:hypothetical protein